jgi:hypothetical protein
LFINPPQIGSVVFVFQQFTQQKESRRTEEKSLKKSEDTGSASGNKRGVTGTQQSTWTPKNIALSSTL